MERKEAYEGLCTKVGKIDKEAETYLRGEARKLRSFEECGSLEGAFFWGDTPQRHGYWEGIEKELLLRSNTEETGTLERIVKPRFLSPLKEAIAIWREKAKGRGERRLCPLCIEGQRDRGSYGFMCESCPVFKATGKKHCLGTPYWKLKSHRDSEHYGIFEDTCEECRKLAKEEADFLQSLLPREEKEEEKEEEEKEEEEKEEKYYLRVSNPEIAIGEGAITVMVVDSKGRRINTGNIFYVNQSKRVNLSVSFDAYNLTGIEKNRKGQALLSNYEGETHAKDK